MQRNYEQTSTNGHSAKPDGPESNTSYAVLGGLFSPTSVGVGERDSGSWGSSDFFFLNRAGRFHFLMRNRYVKA